MFKVDIHSKTVQVLLEQAVQGQVASAYLFCGEAGVGKRSAARAFGETLVEMPLDLIWVEPTVSIEGTLHPVSSEAAKRSQSRAIAQIRLEQIHSIRAQWGLTPHGNRRVVVLESAQTLLVDAGSALLKMMEESITTTFILTADSEDSLLSTVRSRCQIIRFKRWDDQAFRQFVEQQCPVLLEYPSLMSFTRGCPGQAIAAVEVIESLDPQLKIDLVELSQEGWSIVDGFKVMTGLAALGNPETLWLLKYMQHSLWNSSLQTSLKHQGIALIEESLKQLGSHCQRQSMWEVLIWQLCLKKICWAIDIGVM